MNIHWLGHSCFRIKGKQSTLITDPFSSKMVGLPLSKQRADLVTVSHDHGDHNNIATVSSASEKDLFVISGPGEYEVQGIDVQGWKTFHDNQNGAERGLNTVYKIEIEDIKIVHLGDLGHTLDDNMIEEIGQVDILMVPVGGTYTIDHRQAVQITNALSPRIVIPMHYQISGLSQEIFDKLQPVTAFANELSSGNVTPEQKLTVTAAKLPDDMQLVVLDRSS